MKKTVLSLCHLLFISALSLPAIVSAAPVNASEKDSVTMSQLSQSDSSQVNINQATAEQLAEVMLGIGIKKAQNIVSYREQNGPFSSVEQLQDVPGIGIATIERNLSRLKL